MEMIRFIMTSEVLHNENCSAALCKKKYCMLKHGVFHNEKIKCFIMEKEVFHNEIYMFHNEKYGVLEAFHNGS